MFATNAVDCSACKLVEPVICANFAFRFNCMKVSQAPDKKWLFPQSVSEGLWLTVYVCGRSHRGPTVFFYSALTSDRHWTLCFVS